MFYDRISTALLQMGKRITTTETALSRFIEANQNSCTKDCLGVR